MDLFQGAQEHGSLRDHRVSIIFYKNDVFQLSQGIKNMYQSNFQQ